MPQKYATKFWNNYFGEGQHIKDLTIFFEYCQKKENGFTGSNGNWFSFRFRIKDKWYYLNFNIRTKETILIPISPKKDT